ncbi:Hypothetical predicted protein [Cloeon dipterum]|uniref:Uncharacterized protein n=1 Tax=Cloeon dipterum TaxID=197152 RepID=A0A8S1D069_9INSE|nr:Hypothetical predicted protein [Cloeon dipterum]
MARTARTQNKALHFIYGHHVPPPQNIKMLSVPAQLVSNLFKKSLCGLTDYNAMARIIVGRVHRGDEPQHPRLQHPPARTELGFNAAPPALKDCSAAQFLPSVRRISNTPFQFFKAFQATAALSEQVSNQERMRHI